MDEETLADEEGVLHLRFLNHLDKMSFSVTLAGNILKGKATTTATATNADAAIIKGSWDF